MSWIEYQRSILDDAVRNKAFHDALAQVVRRGETTVADIGAGTGFLSFLASRLGARDVVAIEHNRDLLVLAEQLARRNRIRNLTLVNCNSADLVEMTPVDLVVSETLGNYALEENILEILRDARRFLKKGGTLMPCALEQYVAPVTNPAYHDLITSWGRVGYGLDYSAAQALGQNNLYVRRFVPDDLLGEGVCWDRIDLYGKYSSLRKGKVDFVAPRGMAVYGFANWWRAALLPDLWLSTSPFAPATHWEQIHFPVREPLMLKKGDQVSISIQSDSRDGNGVLLKWSVTQHRSGEVIATQAMDLRKGGL